MPEGNVFGSANMFPLESRADAQQSSTFWIFQCHVYTDPSDMKMTDDICIADFVQTEFYDSIYSVSEDTLVHRTAKLVPTKKINTFYWDER